MLDYSTLRMIKGDDAFANLVKVQSKYDESLQIIGQRKYRVEKAVEKSDTSNQVGYALIVNRDGAGYDNQTLKVTEKEIKVYTQPSDVIGLLEGMIQTYPHAVVDPGLDNPRVIFKQDDIDLLGDKYGNYIEASFNPTSKLICCNFMVGRYICTNGANVQVNSKIPHWMYFDSQDISKGITTGEVVEALRIANNNYRIALQNAYNSMVKTPLSEEKFVNLIVPNALDAVYPKKELTALDREILLDEDPEKLQKLDKREAKIQEHREILRVQLINNYNKDDTQNFGNSLFKAFLALSDAETHNQFKSKYALMSAFFYGLAMTRLILKRSGYIVRG